MNVDNRFAVHTVNDCQDWLVTLVHQADNSLLQSVFLGHRYVHKADSIIVR